MIHTRKQLKKYIKADFIMNRGEYTLKKRLISFIASDLIMKELKILRKYEYFLNKQSVLSKLYKLKLHKISFRTGVILAPNVFSYGLVIPHHGTIVVGGDNKIGKYCVLHTSTCITQGNKKIGDGFYLSAGSKIYKDIVVDDNVSLTMNSTLNKNIEKSNVVCAGSPAIIIHSSEAWYIRDGEKYTERVKKCESLKIEE